MVKIIEYKAIQAHSCFVCGTTTRTGGVSLPPFDSLDPGPSWFDTSDAMEENRNIIARAIGWDRYNMVFPVQTHSNHIAVVTNHDRPSGSFDHESGIADTDGLYTEEADLLIGVVTADCHPLLIVDPVRKAAAAIHAGWKGTISGIATLAIKKFIDAGSDPEDLVIAHGPGIEPCCYGVSDEFQDRWTQENPVFDTCFQRKNGQPFFDLRQAIDQELLSLGIKKENLESDRNCTCCRKDLFFSYRRDGEKTGRMFNFVGIKS